MLVSCVRSEITFLFREARRVYLDRIIDDPGGRLVWSVPFSYRRTLCSVRLVGVQVFMFNLYDNMMFQCFVFCTGGREPVVPLAGEVSIRARFSQQNK